MLRNRLPNLFLACLSLLVFLTMAGCEKGPKVTIYISDPDNGGMQFYNQRTEEQGFVPYSQTNNFVCMDPTDTQTLLDYCGIKK